MATAFAHRRPIPPTPVTQLPVSDGWRNIDAGIDIYFCDPHSPWQRGSNENTNGLLRQYFPKGTDLSTHSAQHLTEVAAELNGRPRKRFGWDDPTNRLNQLLSPPTDTTVATKP